MTKGDMIIAQHTLRKDMLKAIHAGHFGSENANSRLELLFLPRNKQQKETLMFFLIVTDYSS